MEQDSGVTSFNSSGSVDISLDALDLSSSSNSNEMSAVAACNDETATTISLETTPAGPALAAAVGSAATLQLPQTPQLIHGPEQPQVVFPGEGDLQSCQIQQKQIPIAKLLSKTGYNIVQANGQRRYGPPPDWEGPAPLRGCEVFVGKLPRDCFEDELVPVFEKVGKIYELRLMLDHYTGLNRGYCFVVFSNTSEAKECVKQLNNFEIRKGRTLGICMSVDNCRLFVGGIPKKVTKEDILLEVRKVTDGVVDVIVYPSASDKSKNRGFAFVEYESHRAAAMARRKLMNGRVDLWGHNIAVDWAEPELEVDEEIMAQVKVLYVRNLMLSTTELQILETFSAFGIVERVKKIKDYAFVHFQSREDACKAMNAINGSVLDGAQVEVTLAKPVDRDTYMRSPKMSRSCTVPAFYIPVDQYGTILPYYPSYFSPPRYMLRNSMGACAMVQVPRTPMGRGLGAGAAGGCGGGGAMRVGSAGGGAAAGGMFYPMTFSPPAPRFVYSPAPIAATPTAVPVYPAPHPGAYYDQSMSMSMSKRSPEQEVVGLPGPAMMEVPSSHAPTATPPTIKAPKTCSMMLEDVCTKNNWGSPVYSLHSSTSTTASGDPDTLFLYKATVVGIGMTYIPSKLCRNLAEAREIAAEHALIQLGYPMEAATSGNFASPPRPAAIQYSEATPPMCSSYVAFPSPPKPGSWSGPGADHPAAIYAPPYTESPFPAAAYPSEFFQPGY